MELFVCFAVWVGVLFIVYLMMKQLKGEGNKKNNKRNYEILAFFELEKGKKKYVALVMWEIVTFVGCIPVYRIVVYEKGGSYVLPVMSFEEKREREENKGRFWEEIIELSLSNEVTKEILKETAICELERRGYKVKGYKWY